MGEGELVCLLGGNASGKSTTLKTILGIVRPRNGHGRVRRRGRDRAARRATGSARDGDRPREPAAVRADDRAREPRDGRVPDRDGQGRKEDFDRVYTLFPLLHERRSQLAGTLSGGEQQMVAMGRALMSRPKLLLMDEPSMGLAPILVERNFEIIKQVHESGVAMLVVEQNANMSLSIADRGYVLSTGRLVLDRPGEGAARARGPAQGLPRPLEARPAKAGVRPRYTSLSNDPRSSCRKRTVASTGLDRTNRCYEHALHAASSRRPLRADGARPQQSGRCPERIRHRFPIFERARLHQLLLAGRAVRRGARRLRAVPRRLGREGRAVGVLGRAAGGCAGRVRRAGQRRTRTRSPSRRRSPPASARSRAACATRSRSKVVLTDWEFPTDRPDLARAGGARRARRARRRRRRTGRSRTSTSNARSTTTRCSSRSRTSATGTARWSTCRRSSSSRTSAARSSCSTRYQAIGSLPVDVARARRRLPRRGRAQVPARLGRARLLLLPARARRARLADRRPAGSPTRTSSRWITRDYSPAPTARALPVRDAAGACHLRRHRRDRADAGDRHRRDARARARAELALHRGAGRARGESS